MLIVGPTTTAKTKLANDLATQLYKAALIPIDAFHIFGVPPFALGVGLDSQMAPSPTLGEWRVDGPALPRRYLYRSEAVPETYHAEHFADILPPERMRFHETPKPSHDEVSDLVTVAAQDAFADRQFGGEHLVPILEGGSFGVASRLLQSFGQHPLRTFVCSPPSGESAIRQRVVDRMAEEDMSAASLLAEGQRLGSLGLADTWLVKKSRVLYNHVLDCLDGRISESEMISNIEASWVQLIVEQDRRFERIRAIPGVTAVPATSSPDERLSLVLDRLAQTDWDPTDEDVLQEQDDRTGIWKPSSPAPVRGLVEKSSRSVGR